MYISCRFSALNPIVNILSTQIHSAVASFLLPTLWLINDNLASDAIIKWLYIPEVVRHVRREYSDYALWVLSACDVACALLQCVQRELMNYSQGKKELREILMCCRVAQKNELLDFNRCGEVSRRQLYKGEFTNY